MINDDAKMSFCLLQEELIHLKTIPNSLAVFCLATYGEGDPTDNAMEFIDWLKNGDADLSGLNYAVRYYYVQRIISGSIILPCNNREFNHFNYFILCVSILRVQAI